MIELRIEHIENLQQILGNTPRQIPIVTARAINRAAEAARTQAGRSVRETYVVKQKDVVSTIKVKKATANNLNADIRSKGSVLKLMAFRVNPSKPQPGRKKQINVTVKKGSRKSISNSFVAQTGNGHVNVFTRVSSKRLPIRGHYGPSVPQMIGNESVMEFVENKARDVLDTRLQHEINRLIGGN